MRFAYIDSNGNEVPIPSVDALALRIELGAINESTDLYDAQADQWGPAHTHEIFHTLSRAAEADEGEFVAPLPPVPPPADDASTLAETEPPADQDTGVAGVPDEGPPSEPPAPEEPTFDPVAAVADLTLADAAEPETPAAPSEGDAEEEQDGFGGLDLSLAEAPVPEPDMVPTETVDDAPDEGVAFDFGDLDGGLEMEGDLGEPPTEAPMDFGADSGGFGDGLEQPMEFTSAGVETPSEGIDLERPMSAFTPQDPPEWMGPEEVEGDDGGVMDFSSISAGPIVADPEADGDSGRVPKDRPSPPKFKRQRSIVGPIVGVVILAALGVGGYVAWPLVQARLAADEQPTEPAVRLPELAESLMPQMTAAAEAAFAAWIADARSSVSSGPARPPGEFLDGIYFANASTYPAVEDFWVGLQDELDAARRMDEDDFRAALDRALAPAGLSDADQTAVAARADAGFEAAEDDRRAVFEEAEAAIEAALRLHAFLVANEANIEHVPAASVTSDPVLEARPSTPEIREAMEERLDEYTRALDALDYLDRPSAEGFWSAVLTQLQATGIR